MRAVQPDRKRRQDAVGHLVLYREHLRQVTVIALRPFLEAGTGIHQLAFYADGLAVSSDAPFEDEVDAQLGTNFLGDKQDAPQGHGLRYTANNPSPRHPGFASGA